MKHPIIIISWLALIITGCKTQDKATAPHTPIILNNSDSVREKTVIQTVYMPVEVFTDLPQQSVKNITAEDSSHVETDLAESDAWINPDGTLGHSIANKPGQLKGSAFVPQTTTITEKAGVKVREIPVPDPYPVYIERKLTSAQQFKLAAFRYLIGIVSVSIIYIFRKPFLKVLRKLIRL